MTEESQASQNQPPHLKLPFSVRGLVLQAMVAKDYRLTEDCPDHKPAL